MAPLIRVVGRGPLAQRADRQDDLVVYWGVGRGRRGSAIRILMPFGPRSNKHFENLYLTGKIDLELTPQGEPAALRVRCPA